MYQVHRLTESLNRASGIDAVVAAAYEWIARPFEACSVVIAVEDGGRLRVAGFAGQPGLARAVHGRSLDQRTISTDVLGSGLPALLPDARALADAYPGAEMGDIQALAALPLTAGGRVLGSCLLGFDHVRHLDAEEQSF